MSSKLSLVECDGAIQVPNNSLQNEIREIYEDLALKRYPDKNKSPSATADFQIINAAYEVLSNEETHGAHCVKKHTHLVPKKYDTPARGNAKNVCRTMWHTKGPTAKKRTPKPLQIRGLGRDILLKVERQWDTLKEEEERHPVHEIGKLRRAGDHRQGDDKSSPTLRNLRNKNLQPKENLIGHRSQIRSLEWDDFMAGCIKSQYVNFRHSD